MSRLPSMLANGLVSVVLVAVAILIYDKLVRVPLTPRLAVVDVNSLYAAATKQATRGALAMVDRSRTDTVEPKDAQAALGEIERSANDFGPRLTAVLNTLAEECACTVVAMAAVYGERSGIPNYTHYVAEKLGVSVE